MKHRKRTIWAVAFGIAACTAVTHADKPQGHGTLKPAAPVVQLPPDAGHVVVATPLGGPAVTLPYRGGIEVAGTSAGTAVAIAAVPATPPPKVATAAGGDTPPAPRSSEAGPLVNLAPK